LVFAVRECGGRRELAGFPELLLEGLSEGDARALLESVVTGALDEHVRDRIVAETRGNPLALLELPRGLSAAELAGGFGSPDALALPVQIEESFLRRLAALPPDTRRLLLVAAADPVGEPQLVWRAAEHLGIGDDARAHARADGLVAFGARVRFRHPLVRSAIYRAASSQDTQSVHAALAQATDPEVDPDRRAWHRARAAPGPDEDVAAELERSAGRAQTRGGPAAAAAFLERAAELTPDPARRAPRALAAAEAKHQSGALGAALELLATVPAGALDDLERARVDLLRAQIAFALSRGRDAPRLLLEAAKRLEPLDVARARETHLEALSAALFVGRLPGDTGLPEVARAALAAPPAGPAPRATDLLLDGLALRFTAGYEAAVPVLGRALRAFRIEEVSTEEAIRWLWLASATARDLWDDETWEVLAARHVQLARDAGALTVLPLALSQRIAVHVHAGELAAAASLIEELEAVTEAAGIHLANHGAVTLAAWQGREAAVSKLVEAGATEAAHAGDGIGLTICEWATAVLYNGLGRYDDAFAASQQAGERPDAPGIAAWSLVELVEAAARSGKAGRAADALQRLSETTRVSGTDWALGIEARSRALISEGQVAEDLYREAIDRLGRTRIRADLARAHLLYGEWLRRERRRLDARDQLRTAREMLAAMGIEAFAARAARELEATGETVRRRTVETVDELTPQEAVIAQLAREGRSNLEIGGRLFISPRTVEYHLTKVFAKLGIGSRKELPRIAVSAAAGSRP
jgi:DNA-binding CsgD family transcriptional regulator